MISKAVAIFWHIVLYKKKKKESISLNKEVLSPEDIEAGRHLLIHQSQLEFFSQEIKLMSMDLKPLNVHAKGMKTEITHFNPFLEKPLTPPTLPPIALDFIASSHFQGLRNTLN